jgi:predicted Fe-Mo cluster-binding NifX family protein
MKAAFTVWDEKISPVFDSANKLLIVEIKNKEIKKEFYANFNPKTEDKLIETLALLGIDELVCGAITQHHMSIIEGGTIKLISFIGGNIKDILETYAMGNPLIPGFLMPGCTVPGVQNEA